MATFQVTMETSGIYNSGGVHNDTIFNSLRTLISVELNPLYWCVGALDLNPESLTQGFVGRIRCTKFPPWCNLPPIDQKKCAASNSLSRRVPLANQFLNCCVNEEAEYIRLHTEGEVVSQSIIQPSATGTR